MKMNFLTFLAEYSYIIPHTYGAWISPRKVIPVEHEEHLETLFNHLSEFGFKPREIPTVEKAFNNGWIRAIFEWGYPAPLRGDPNALRVVSLEGIGDSLKKVWPKIAHQVYGGGSNNATVYLVDVDTGEMDKFILPNDKNKLITWMNNR